MHTATPQETDPVVGHDSQSRGLPLPLIVYCQLLDASILLEASHGARDQPWDARTSTRGPAFPTGTALALRTVDTDSQFPWHPTCSMILTFPVLRAFSLIVTAPRESDLGANPSPVTM